MNLSSTNPAKDYEIIGEVNISTEEEILEKVQKAHVAKESWRGIGIQERVKLMRKVYEALDRRRDDISKLATAEMGFPKSQQEMFDLGDGFNYFNWYLENSAKTLAPEVTYESESEIHRVYHEPYGVAAIIQPWNFPFCQWSWSVVPNLLVGNTVVLKHSEECLLSGKLIEEIVNEILPEGVFNEVYGDGKIGEILLNQDVNLVVFTGSTKTGKKIYELAGKKFIKVVLEMGGSAPGIVFDDADIDASVEHIFNLRFTNNGQCCDGLKRLIVHESKFEEVVQKLKDIIQKYKIGDPTEEDTFFGPLSAKKQQELLISQVEDAISKGAKIELGGKVPQDLKGAFYEPTLLTNISKDMRVWKEEVFGPVLPVISFKTYDEALELANDTDYGLGGYVYSKDIEKANKFSLKLQTGMVSINGVNYVCPWNPFGGYKNSGMGREHGHCGLHDISQVKLIAENKI